MGSAADFSQDWLASCFRGIHHITMQPPVSKPTARNHQLDALRGVAILFVLGMHWISTPWIHYCSGFGVKTFFVLSGFFVTGLLFRARDQAAERSVWSRFKNFQIGRIIRIYPPYFLVLGLALALGIRGAADSSLWVTTFTMNFYLAFKGVWAAPFFPLWSCATQEQFYLLWPFVIFLLKRSWLPYAIGAVIAGSLASRLALGLVFSHEHLGMQTLMPCTADALAMGSWLAWLRYESRDFTELARSAWFRGIMWTGMAGMVAIYIAREFAPPDQVAAVLNAAFPTFQGLFLMWVIVAVANGMNGVVGWFLDLKVLQWLGALSYGLYLFHIPCDIILRGVFERYGVMLPEFFLMRFLTSLVATLAIAIPVYFWLERPLATLKKSRKIRPPETVGKAEPA